ncbi:MAG TPA: alpha/beta hydrolase [Kofleriaceae bacterium]|nr:alpha/beta hydrolase [Kofleriaceae bacterium]
MTTSTSTSNDGFQETRLDINGIDTLVLTAGTGEPVVFLHGAGTASGFDWLLPIAQHFRVIVAHHPGFGRSGGPALPGVDHLARHHLDVLDRLGVARFRLVGQSMGGWTAATLASYSTQRIVKLALVAPVGHDVPDHPTVNLLAVPPAEVPGYLTASPAILARMSAPPPSPEFLAARIREAESFAIVQKHGLTHESGLGRWLHRIDVPTLLLWGEADRTVPFAQAAVWAAALPKASIKSFAGAGHLLFEERPETASALVDFLRD